MQLSGDYNFQTLVQALQGHFTGRETSEDKKHNELVLEYFNIRIVLNTSDNTVKVYRISFANGRKVLQPLMKFTGERL